MVEINETEKPTEATVTAEEIRKVKRDSKTCSILKGLKYNINEIWMSDTDSVSIWICFNHLKWKWSERIVF